MPSSQVSPSCMRGALSLVGAAGYTQRLRLTVHEADRSRCIDDHDATLGLLAFGDVVHEDADPDDVGSASQRVEGGDEMPDVGQGGRSAGDLDVEDGFACIQDSVVMGLDFGPER